MDKKIKKLISLIETATRNKLVLTESDSTPAVRMTTNEFEKNQDTVKDLTSKGYDVELSDLQEADDEISENDSVDFAKNMISQITIKLKNWEKLIDTNKFEREEVGYIVSTLVDICSILKIVD